MSFKKDEVVFVTKGIEVPKEIWDTFVENLEKDEEYKSDERYEWLRTIWSVFSKNYSSESMFAPFNETDLSILFPDKLEIPKKRARGSNTPETKLNQEKQKRALNERLMKKIMVEDVVKINEIEDRNATTFEGVILQCKDYSETLKRGGAFFVPSSFDEDESNLTIMKKSCDRVCRPNGYIEFTLVLTATRDINEGDKLICYEQPSLDK